ncbi:MAG: O-antigen ligase [Synechococcales bacterium]|nr:O-antigen ligase [Synechococcales bacterium]
MSLKLAEKIFVVSALLFYTGAIAWCIPGTSVIGFLKDVTAWLGCLLAIIFLLPYWKQAAYLILKNPLLVCLTVVVPASILWSDFPMFTFWAIVPFLRVTIFGIYFAVRFNMREQMQLLTWMLGIAAILSIVWAIVIPKYGVVGMGFIANSQDEVHTGTWRGIYIHKTFLGTIMSLGMSSFILSWFSYPKRRLINGVGLFLCTLVLLCSTTKGAIAVLVLSGCLIPLCRPFVEHYKLRMPFFILIFLSIFCLGFLTFNYAEQALSMLGRDITISGRTNYWPPMLNKLWERPWFGYGYDTFWVGGWHGEPAGIWRFLADGDEPPHAHNGYLNLWFDIGLVGLVTFGLSYVVNWFRAITWLSLVPTGEGLVPIVYLAQLGLFNLTESLLMEPDIFWLFYVAISLSICRVSQISLYWNDPIEHQAFRTLPMGYES